MGRKFFANATAVAFSVVLAAALIPACTIHLGPGGDGRNGTGDAQPGPADGGWSPGEQTDPGGDADSIAEEEATIAALNEAVARADPREIAIADLRTQYAAYALAGTIEAQGGDPATVDPAALQQLVDQVAPGVWEQARQWAESLDPATVELATITPREDCVNKWDFGCRRKEYCDFKDGKTYGTCIVTGCGEGRCQTCPDLWDLSALVVKGWCSYTCVRDKQIVGIKAVAHIRIAGKLPVCMLFENPIPLEE
jgi:hypothetical protein